MCSAENGAKCSTGMRKDQSQLGKVSDAEELKRRRSEFSTDGPNLGRYCTRAAHFHIVLSWPGPIITVTCHVFYYENNFVNRK